MVIKILFFSLIFLFLGCSENYLNQVYDKRILDQEIKCMRLLVFPPNETIEDTLNDLYSFDKDCDLDLVVSYKDNITCNSNQNVDKKAQGMPSAYLRYELKKANKLYYSYYIDLEEIKPKHLKDGFKRMKNTLKFEGDN